MSDSALDARSDSFLLFSVLLALRYSQIYGDATASESWAPARGPVPPLARRALTGAGGAGGDNPKIKL